MKIARLSALLLFFGLLSQPHAAQGQEGQPLIQIISSAPDNIPGDDKSTWPAVSPDGRYVAFVSRASNLTPQDTNASADIFTYSISTSNLVRSSVTSDGGQASAGSFQPVLSANGRILAFMSFAANLTSPDQSADTNGLPDIFAHDRSTGATWRVSVSSNAEEASGWSEGPAISSAGRYLVFASRAAYLHPLDSDTASDIYLHDLDAGTTRPVSVLPPEFPQNGAASHAQISADGRYVVFRYQAPAYRRIIQYDRLTGQASLAGEQASLPEILAFTRGPHISPDGELIYWTALTGQGETLLVYLRSSGDIQSFPSSPGSPPPLDGLPPPAVLPDALQISLSAGGQLQAFTGEMDGLYQVFLHDGGKAAAQPALVSGWVVDTTGRPLAGVSVRLDAAHAATTGVQGSFRFDSVNPGQYTLSAAKKGFTLTPEKRSITAAPGSVATIGLEFAALPQGAIDEAAKDLGMPYSQSRGCASPFEACGGPYHGFYSGDCTDLVLDAYTAGMEYNIQLALEADFRDHPRHYYRWRNARNAHDMWRYFAYTQQIRPPDEPYQIGDIVFFDWQLDGVIDHVAIISEVGRRSAPRKMLDATGFIDDNPTGLASELEWKPYHSQRTPGHARWNGRPWGSDPFVQSASAYLLASVDSPLIQARLLDNRGRAAGSAAIELPGAEILDTGIGTVISLAEPQNLSEWYYLELTAPGTADSAAVPYQVGIQLIQAGEVTGLQTFTGSLAPGETRLIAIQIKSEGDRLTLHLSPSP